MRNPVGILALQGASNKHIDMLARLGVDSLLVRKPEQLARCGALILPGGESTTMSLLIDEYGLREPVVQFASEHPVMGVCAGMILMAHSVDDSRVKPLQIMPYKAKRNHYGSQLHSFSAEIQLAFDNAMFEGVFIRAPAIEHIDDNCEVLAEHQGRTVMLANGKHVALSFHPELTDDTRIHHYWLKLSNEPA